MPRLKKVVIDELSPTVDEMGESMINPVDSSMYKAEDFEKIIGSEMLEDSTPEPIEESAGVTALKARKIQLKKDLPSILKSMDKDYAVSRTTDFASGSLVKSIPRIRSGVLSFDYISSGGVPQGRIIEFYGNESSSKTTMSLRIAGNAQKMGLFPCFVDIEGTFSAEWASRFLDINDLLLSQPETGEEAAEFVDTLIKSGTVDLIILDSVAAMTPSKEIAKTFEELTVGEHARLLNKCMRKWTSSMNQTFREKGVLVTIILINQIRQKVGIMYGSNETKTGGMGLNFAASLVVKMWKGKPVLDSAHEDRPIMEDMNMKVTKSKVGPAHSAGVYTMLHRDLGMKKQGDVYQEEQMRKLAIKYGLLEKKGKEFQLVKPSTGEILTATRQEDVDQILLDNPDIAQALYEDLLNFLIAL